VNASYDNSAAVVVLPPVSGGRLQDKSLRAWLARADLQVDPDKWGVLSRILPALGLPYPEEGLAALRMWGQTGDRPTVWLAAADPVYLEPRLDHLCLHAPKRDSVASVDLRALIDHLQLTLANEQQYGFVRLGASCYLRANEPMATASVPAYVVDQQVPSEFLPAGKDTASYRNLLSEIEMSLHDHEVNQRRIAEGEHPINSLWLWGGGYAPQRVLRSQPPLFSNDPLLLGYWDSAIAEAELWPGSIAECLESCPAGFVAVVPQLEDDPEVLPDCLRELHAALRAKRISRLTLLFRDGLRAEVERSHVLRVWRRDSSFLD